MLKPLADRFRPQTLEDIVGQKHLLAEGKPLRRIIESGEVPNLIFYGPSGVGKTTLAAYIANKTNKTLRKLNGTTASTADIKEIVSQLGTFSGLNGILLYLDEIQYFNKKQQQTLLEYIENGSITLIASTTENPYFYVYNAILSRSTVFEFKSVEPEEVEKAVYRAARLLEQTQREISRLKQDLEAQRQALRQAEEAAEGDPALQQKLTEVGGELRQIEAQLPSYEALERQAKERKQCLDRARAAEEAQKAAEKALNEAAAKLELLDQALKRLENVDVELVNANSALEECQKRYRALKGARQEAAAIRKEEEALAGEWETFKRLSEEAVAAKAHSLDLYARFVAGQAGRLAGDLRGEIEKCGEANCPVCGTRFGRDGLAGHTHGGYTR